MGSGNLGLGKEERKGSGWVLEGEREKSGPGSGKGGDCGHFGVDLGSFGGHFGVGSGNLGPGRREKR